MSLHMAALKYLLAVAVIVLSIAAYQFLFIVYDHPGNLFGKTNVAGREIKYSRGPDGVIVSYNLFAHSSSYTKYFLEIFWGGRGRFRGWDRLCTCF